MSYWNYRVMCRTYGTGIMASSGSQDEPESTYGIYEVYYNDDGSIYAYSKEPRNVVENTVDELKGTLTLMQNCLSKPVLNYDEIAFVSRVDDE